MARSRYQKTSTGKRRSIYDKAFKELVPVLDKVFSEYIRLKNADANGICQCATCGQRMYWREITNGHYVSRNHYNVRWDEQNCAPQCVHDNSFAGGKAHVMRAYLVDRHGEGAVATVEMKAEMKSGETVETLREKILYYRGQVKKLKSEKGL